MITRSDQEKREEQTHIARQYQAQTEKRRGEAHGVVVTPVEIVDFQIRAVIDQLAKQGKTLGSPEVAVTDPFGGTGIYAARLMQIAQLTPDELDDLFHNRLLVIEIDPTAARIAALNLHRVYAEEANRFPRSSPVIVQDTFTIE